MKKNYVVCNHEFINTGGNCMVSMFTVYDKQQNVTRFMLINEEGVSYQTADTFSSDELLIDCDEAYDTLVLHDVSWSSLTDWRTTGTSAIDGLDRQLLELMVECRFEYLKRYCKLFKCTVNVTYQELPTRLQEDLSPACVTWHTECESYFTTDGYTVSPSTYYEQEGIRENIKAKAAVAFRGWLLKMVNDAESCESLYDQEIQIILGDHVAKLPFDAETYHALDNLLVTALEVW